MKPKKGKLYTLELKWHVDPVETSSGIAVWDRRLELVNTIKEVFPGLIYVVEGITLFTSKSH